MMMITVPIWQGSTRNNISRSQGSPSIEFLVSSSSSSSSSSDLYRRIYIVGFISSDLYRRSTIQYNTCCNIHCTSSLHAYGFRGTAQLQWYDAIKQAVTALAISTGLNYAGWRSMLPTDKIVVRELTPWVRGPK
eukprot:9145476-Pyramimonas_sp.AAC.3